jgi:hypothetical protein
LYLSTTEGDPQMMRARPLALSIALALSCATAVLPAAAKSVAEWQRGNPGRPGDQADRSGSLTQGSKPLRRTRKHRRRAKAPDPLARAKAARPKPAKPSKMNSWELRELEGLPDAIAALEAQQAELAGKLADGSLYRDAPAEVERINGELAKLESELEERFARWELLEARREGTL